jgi:hypothetical protein
MEKWPQLRIFIYPETLTKLGEQLKSYFPKNGNGEVGFEYGAEDDKIYSHVKLTVFYISPAEIGVQVRTHNNRECREAAICEFCIRTTLQEVNELGKRITSWTEGNEKTLHVELGAPN